MNTFEFTLPTKVYFGPGRIDDIGDILNSYGYKTIFLVTGSKSLKKSGAFDRLVGSLTKHNITYILYEGVKPNPDISYVKEGLEKLKTLEKIGGKHVDILLACGGGSVMDVAKSIAVNYFYDGDPLDFSKHLAVPTKALPVACIPTIFGSGSEGSDSCVLSSYEDDFKQGFNSPLVRPKFCILDPELTATVPERQLAAGIIDMMMHSMERYFTGNEFALSDAFAFSVIKNAMNNGLRLFKDKEDKEARASLMADSFFSHNGLTSFGKKFSFIIHPLEHALSALKPEITHGLGVGVVFLGWAKYVYLSQLDKFSTFSHEVFNLTIEDKMESSIMGIKAWENFLKELQAPTSLRELGITGDDINEIVRIATEDGTHVIGQGSLSLKASDVQAIYRLVL